ncbi:MAG TPA: hypothetical protein VIV60_27160, partial [Polyangiaceae bacterium]
MTHAATAPVGHSGETGWLKVDKAAAMFPYAFGERAQWGMSVCSPRVVDWNWFALCQSLKSNDTESHERFGALAALSFAREVLFELGTTMTTDSDRQKLAAALTTVERLTGKTTVIRRPYSVDVLLPASMTAPTLVNPAGGGKNPGFKAAAIDPQYAGPNGVGRSTLDAEPATAGTRTLGTGATAALAQVSWTRTTEGLWPGNTSLLLKWPGTTPMRYTFISETREVAPSRYEEPNATIALDGWFWDLVGKTSAVSSNDWSEPTFDGFGLPKRWVPPADASLMGGSAGEESYTYLLRSAKVAAEEATAAVKTAIDKLAEEARDETALRGGESKAKMIGGQELYSLCGEFESATPCDFDLQYYDFRFANIDATCAAVPSGGVQICKDTLNSYGTLLSREPLPSRVGVNSPEYSGVINDGSELDRIINRLWNASRLVIAARDQAEKLGVAAGMEQVASDSALAAATAAQVAADAQLTQLDADYKSQVDGIRARIAQANADVGNAKWKVNAFCNLWTDSSERTALKEVPDHDGLWYKGKKIGDKDTAAGAFSRCTEALGAHGNLIANRDA